MKGFIMDSFHIPYDNIEYLGVVTLLCPETFKNIQIGGVPLPQRKGAPINKAPGFGKLTLRTTSI